MIWGFSRATSSLVIPGYWATALLMARHGLVAQSVNGGLYEGSNTEGCESAVAVKFGYLNVHPLVDILYEGSIYHSP